MLVEIEDDNLSPATMRAINYHAIFLMAKTRMQVAAVTGVVVR